MPGSCDGEGSVANGKGDGANAIADCVAARGDVSALLGVSEVLDESLDTTVAATTLGDADGAVARADSAGRLAATAVAYWITGDSTGATRGKGGCRFGEVDWVAFDIEGLGAGTGFVSLGSGKGSSVFAIKASC